MREDEEAAGVCVVGEPHQGVATKASVFWTIFASAYSCPSPPPPGDVTAAIIGTSVHHMTVIGDAVNVASRM